ncbi:hypothetical protein GJ496_009453 [Pomphorhynchus laevis]|nr:hypothetical protein GJ496_009453 [Pomphorhynchus laevis]
MSKCVKFLQMQDNLTRCEFAPTTPATTFSTYDLSVTGVDDANGLHHRPYYYQQQPRNGELSLNLPGYLLPSTPHGSSAINKFKTVDSPNELLIAGRSSTSLSQSRSKRSHDLKMSTHQSTATADIQQQTLGSAAKSPQNHKMADKQDVYR